MRLSAADCVYISGLPSGLHPHTQIGALALYSAGGLSPQTLCAHLSSKLSYATGNCFLAVIATAADVVYSFTLSIID